jgi:hypothetical protein
MLGFKDGLTSYQEGGALDTWQPNSNPCGNPIWDGVGCQGGWVTRVTLQEQGLVGGGLMNLLRLSRLQELDVYGNRLTGVQPARV